jgi:5-methylcytosine-specific restriction endonuclease McrA
MKKPSKSSLKKKLWKLVSEYIRRRDANRDGFAECCTCGVMKPWKELQCGHFIGGRRNSVIYELTNMHSQCYGCNVCKYGETLKYLDFMLEKYGEAEVKRLRALNETSVVYTIQDYQNLISEFQTKLLTLK